ncbi:hypothetical protein AVEN_214387-1 [Araneus ventricosus]|uniref:Uncharacterized protein n=1 Tax=Araneus ventricosus TaxID=182803 RepID=A0A4Y2HNV0_ARAVE|nr:hypothetical protein AVEN_214387-1 [Araneus ventricosus]
MKSSKKGTPTEFGLKYYKNCIWKLHQWQHRYSLNKPFLKKKSSLQEIDDILTNIPKGKAPGYDGIDNIFVKVMCNSFPNLMLCFFNECLELKCFPDPLKIRLVILFHKTGKDEHKIKSYTPITLFPTLGKLLGESSSTKN